MELDRLPRHIVVAAALGAGLAFQLLLGTSYLAAFLDPMNEGEGVPVALVVLDEGPRGRELATRLHEADAPVRWVELTSRERAIEELRAKRLHGALIVPEGFSQALESFASDEPRPARLERILNPAAGAASNVTVDRVTSAAVESLRARVREEALRSVPQPAPGLGAVTVAQARFVAEPVLLESTQVNPVPQEGANGLAPTYLAMAAWVGGYLGSVALERFRAQLRLAPLQRAGLIAAAAAAQGVLATAAALAIGLEVRDAAALALVITLATWMAYALVGLILDVLGLAGVVPAFAILCIGLPASGAVYPVGMLPPFFAAVHAIDPFTWVVEGLRTALYAPGAGDLGANAARLALLALTASGASVVWARWRAARKDL